MICYTVGHSTGTTDKFISLLSKYKIKYLVDVRSTPYSKHAPQFNSEALKATLKANGIIYGHMGKELGARYDDPNLLFTDGRVDFSKVRKTDNFKNGIDRIINGIKQGHMIALMCTEKEPFECHRFCLVSYELSKQGATVLHILEDGTLISNDKLEERLLRKYRPEHNQISLLGPTKSRDELVEECYVEHNKQIGYINEED
jgi:uncharacterized protein (DUF488 family)